MYVENQGFKYCKWISTFKYNCTWNVSKSRNTLPTIDNKIVCKCKAKNVYIVSQQRSLNKTKMHLVVRICKIKFAGLCDSDIAHSFPLRKLSYIYRLEVCIYLRMNALIGDRIGLAGTVLLSPFILVIHWRQNGRQQSQKSIYRSEIAGSKYGAIVTNTKIPFPFPK